MPSSLIPPDELSKAVGGDFVTAGEEFLRHLVDLGGLEPHFTMLDVGCGCGRMAVPLTRFLTSGRYEGFDVDKKAIDWCTENISVQNPNFSFHHVDLYNSNYNPSGKIKPADFAFPFQSQTFDLVLAASVFTHMTSKDVDRYISEIGRVLKPGGTLFATFFLLTGDSIPAIKKGLSSIPFRRRIRRGLTTNPRKPEEAVAYDCSFIFDTISKHGFWLERLYFGAWIPRVGALTGQDVLIARRSL